LAYFAAVARRRVSAVPSLGGCLHRVSAFVILLNFPGLGVIVVPAHPDAGFYTF